MKEPADAAPRPLHDECQDGLAGDQRMETRLGDLPQVRREATAREARALAHPMRLRILRLCWEQEMTNKQLADRLGKDPGAVLYHVRQLIDAGFLEAGEVRSGAKGALERPYRTKGWPWWIDAPLAGFEPDVAFAPIAAFLEELREAGPGSVRMFERFMLHLDAEDIAELDRRILTILDEYVASDHLRRHKPALGGILILHQMTNLAQGQDGMSRAEPAQRQSSGGK